MNISPQWTDTERLQVIAILMQQIQTLAGEIRAGYLGRICQLAETAFLVATMSATFLEQNRANILRDLE